MNALGKFGELSKARVALCCDSSYSYTFFELSKLLCASITRYMHAKHEQILKFKWHRLQVLKELWCWVKGRV